jgi:hypothetical protein
MSTTKTKPARGTKPTKPAKGTMNVTAGEILSGVDGMQQLCKLAVPVEIGTDWHIALQALRFAAKPLEDIRDKKVQEYAKKKGGKIVYGDQPGQIVLDPNRLSKFNEEMATFAKKRIDVAVTPISRAEIPRKVNGKDVVIAPEVFELLGPFLVP